MKEKIKNILTKIKNNKKKVVGITLGVFLTFIFTFTVYNMNNPTYFNRLFASIGSVPNEAFEDSDFYNCIIDEYNNENSASKAYTDSLTDEELASITNLTCTYKSIESIKGVEKLTGLITLNLSGNRLTSIDLSNNKALTILSLSDNQLTSIDLSDNIDLENLNLRDNELTSTSVNLERNHALTVLNLGHNNIFNIDLSDKKNIVDLDLERTNLYNIDLSNNNALINLNLSETNIKKLDLSNNVDLKNLNLEYSEIVDLNLNNNKNLENLNLNFTKISTLDLSNNTNLSSLDIDGIRLIEDILIQNGESYIIEEKIIPPSGQDFSYSVDDTSVASIQGNVVTALKEGTTTLKTKFGNFSFERNLTIGDIELSTNKDEMNINNEEKYIYCNYNCNYNLYLGSDNNNNDIKTNAGSLVKEDDIIKVVLGSKVIAEYKLVYIEQAVGMNDNYLLLSLLVDNPSYINGVNCTYELLDNGNEIVVKYNGKEIDRKKLVYMYLPVGSKYFSEMLYISTVKEINELMINNINDVSQIDKNKINILNAKMTYKNDDGEYLSIDDGEKFVASIRGIINIISEQYDLTKDYIYLGSNEFNNDIYILFGGEKISTGELLSYGFLNINDNIVEIILDGFPLDSWPLIKVTSDKYDMSGDKIDLKGEDIDLSKINVTNALLKVDNDKLLVMYNDEIVKEFKLENAKKEDTTKPSSEEKTTTTTKVTTKENKKTTTKETTTKKKESIIDKIFGKSETTTKKEETTTKSIIVKRTNKTTKIESNSDTINNNSKNSTNKIVTKSNILILLLSIIDIALIIYIVINKKNNKEA